MSKYLHKQDDWELRTLQDNKYWGSWIYHRCETHDVDANDNECTWSMSDCHHGKCSWCDTPIPDEIYGIWKLHNFDSLWLIPRWGA